MEFGLVGSALLLIMIATSDLGRYFITQHSLRTLTAEAARAVMVSCFNATAACPITSAQKTTVIAKTPFLVAASTTLTATQGPPAAGTGQRTITVSATYPFSFFFPLWSNLGGNITETATVIY